MNELHFKAALIELEALHAPRLGLKALAAALQRWRFDFTNDPKTTGIRLAAELAKEQERPAPAKVPTPAGSMRVQAKVPRSTNTIAGMAVPIRV